MSENDPSQTPSKQTSSVPLKKETVRVTLKAADAPPAAPVASVPGAPAVKPPTPPPAPPVASSAPRPPAPAPTIALKPAGAPTAPAPAPTIKLATSSAPVGAPTIALKTATQPLGGGAPSLPKATVQLQAPTQPLSPTSGSVSQMATFEMGDDEEESGVGGFVKFLSIVGFIAACVLFYFQFDIAKTWIDAEDRDPLIKGDYQQLLEAEPNA